MAVRVGEWGESEGCSVMGHGGFGLLRHGHTTLPAYREHLNYRGMSFKRNRVSPYRSLQGEDQPQGGSMAVRVSELRGSECCPVIGQIEVASPRGDKITSPETELTSCWCSARELLRNRCMKQSK